MTRTTLERAAFFAALVISSGALAQPANDLCAGAEIIPATGPFPYFTSTVADVSLATHGGSEPTPSCQTSVSRSIWYSFTAPTNGTYVFSTCSDSGAGTTVTNTVVGVYESAGGCAGPFTEVPGGGCDDNSCNLSASQAVSTVPLTAGVTYYVLVYKQGTTAPSAGTTAVQLLVSAHPVPGNDVCGGAVALQLDAPILASNHNAANNFEVPAACFSGIGQTVTTAPGRDTVWSFTAPTAGRYSFRTTRSSHESSDTVLYLASSCPTGGSPNQVGTCLAAANRKTTGSTATAEDISCYQMNAGEIVYAFLDEVTASTGTTAQLEVTRCGLETESNNTPATANVFACPAMGAINTNGDVDFFDVGVIASGYRMFAVADGVAANNQDIDLRVTTSTLTLEYDDANNDTLMGGSSPNVSGTPLTGVQSYLRMSYFNTTTTSEPYRLYGVVRPPISSATPEVEPNDTPAAATPATYAAGTLGGSAPSTDVDYYSFTANAGDLVVVGLDLDPLRDNTSLRGALALFDANGVMLIDANDTGTSTSTTAGTSLSSSNPFTLGEAFTYRVNATGTYFVRVNIGATGTTATTGDYVVSISRNCDNGIPAPTLAAVSPASGPTAGGTTLTITGTNFLAPAAVMIDGTLATSVTVVSPTQITAVTPAHAAGSVAVTVFNPDGKRAVLTSAFTYVAPPAISAVTPASGPTAGGTGITLTGTNFAPGATLTIGGVAATNVVVVSGTTLTATTPAGAEGAAAVVVTNPDGQSGTSTFTYLAPPSIAAITPNSGPTAGGTTVTISGTSFQPGATVTIGGAAATVGAVTATSITLTTPAGPAGAADVVVTNPDGQADSEAAAFTFVAPPVVTSITPVTGFTTGGDTITINGQDFVTGATVTFDGLPATAVTFVSATQLTAVTPAHAPGAVDVAVTNPDGQVDTVPGAFTYIPAGPPPAPATVTPNTGTTAGGTTVTITGADFQSGATVTFGGTPATTVTFVSATELTAVSPAHSFGQVDVVVTNPDLQSGTITNGFTYAHPAPVLNSITPSSGPTAGGTSVTLAGQNFLTGATFTLGGVAATNVTVVNDTTITGTAPAHGAGAVDVVLTNADGQVVTLTGGFTYLAPPSVASITPASGTTLGGESFTLTGADFLPGATVSFGGTAATNVTVVSATSITGTTPAHAPGQVSLTVTNGDGQVVTVPNGFTFILPPVASSVTPASGPEVGGTNITITGSAFNSAATVTVGGAAAANVVVVSATQITATTPAGTEGAQDVVVTNPDGQSSTLSGAFTYIAAPLITAVTPATGPTKGGTLVTLTGDNFSSGALVVFGTKTVPATVVSATQLTVTTPSNAAGAVDVTVRNTDTQTATLPAGFTYLAPPTIASVLPNHGAAAGGTQVTISGTAFQTGATVTFGGVPATNVTVEDKSTITAIAPAHALGFVDVVVTNPDNQSATLFQAFEYVEAPTLASLTPATGPATGATQVTLTGTGFASGTTVQFGEGLATSVVFQSPTTLVAVTPAHPAGLVDVKVTNPDGQSAQLDDAFTFEPVAPTLTLITPAQGPGDGNTPVLLAGSGFLPGATVTFDGVPATEVVVVNVNSITARTPPHAQGEVDVVVTNPDLTLATLVDGYRYTSDPTVEEPDAGQPTKPDAGVADAGTVDFNGGSTGCGCASTDVSSLMGFALVALGSLFSRRRSRKIAK